MSYMFSTSLEKSEGNFVFGKEKGGCGISLENVDKDKT